MILIFLLCATVQSTPIKDVPLELSKLSKYPIAQNKLITLLHDAKKLPQIYFKRIHGIDHPNNEKGNKKLTLNNLEDFTKEVHYEDITDHIKLAFNDEAVDLLKKLTDALVEVNENLSKQNKKLKQVKSKQIYVVKVKENERYARHKRDTNNSTEKDNNDVKALEVDNNTAIATEAVTVSEKPAEEEIKSTEAKTVANETSTNTNITEVPNCNQTIHSRRSYYAENDNIATAVKNRLLSYINEYFNDITTKTNSLRDIKRSFAANDEYSIGYIIANIDTLGINLHDLRVDIELNHKGWTEKQILDMFDKIKMSHSVVSSLLGALKTILDRSPVKESKSSQYLHLVHK